MITSSLSGGGADESPGYNFYQYSISGNSWGTLKPIPCPVGYYVGNRFGYANSTIYYWQGAPSTWDCGGDAFYMFNWSGKSDPSAHIVINEIEQNPSGIDAGNEWVELYNPTTSDVNLDGWKLSTTHGVTVTVTLYGTIPANGYFVYTHTTQWLDNEVESVILRDSSWNEIDRTPYLTDTSNSYYSWQRYPNGEDTDSDSDWEFRASTIGRNNDRMPIAIYIDDDFVDDPPNHKWNTIQKGINAAFNDDTIIVKDGIYDENLNVYKRLTIRSENGSDVTIVQAASVYDHVFEVTADWVNITGFTTTGTEYPYAGIYLYGADHCNVSYNTASNNWKGICLWYSSNNTIIDNNASNNSYDIYLSYSSGNTLTNDCGSIHLDSSGNNTITNSTCSNHHMGIYLSSSSNNTLIGNTISNNTHGIYLSCSSNNNTLTGNNASNNECGIYLSYSSDNMLTSNIADSNSDDGIRVLGSDKNDYNNSIDTTNTVNDKPVYYFFNENGIVLDELDAGHLTLAYCSDFTIKNSNISNGDGIYLSSSSNNTLANNTANSNSDYGIYLSYSINNTLTSNRMSDNKHNFGVSGWNDSYFDNNIDITNLVDGKPVQYIKSADGMTFDHNTHAGAGTIYCIQCNNITIKDLTLTNNGVGVFFWKTNNSRIENVNASNNSEGIRLQYSSNNTINASTCSNNDDDGICMLYSSNNMLTDNNASNNQYGIYSSHSSNSTLTSNVCSSNIGGILLWHISNNTITANTCSNNNGNGISMYSSSNNTLTGNRCSNNNDGGITILWKSCNNLLYHNNLINNNGNAYDYSSDFSSDPVCTNFWNSSTEGNYYSDYTGCDNDTDGIGDTPYSIPIDGTDHFPLMQPWSEDTQQKGDLNGDGQITAADAIIALQMAVSGEHSDPADMNGDGRVSSVDALMIMQAAAGFV